MSLTLYKNKRSFDETPEPKGKKKSSGQTLKFVVQKHDATSLHYDFRLEMEGVLKSWAVPKGPSLNPQDKRLAMMVEDHPFDYRTFEGTIPAGNYGAGTVMVWDEGTYAAMGFEEEPIKKQEKILLEEMKKGDVKIVLYGEKLKGAFALVKIKGRGENTWLLIKKQDAAATDKDITKKDKSVKSNRTLTQIAKDAGGNPKEKKSLVTKTAKPVQLLSNRSSKNPRVKKKSSM
jgi:bifunctional non-homologous end joining protein LigD